MAIITKDIKEGFEVSGKVKTVTSYKTWLFSGGWPRFTDWPAKNVHTDLEFAKSCGLPTRAASGSMSIGYLTELMIDLFGENWLRGGKIKVKLIGIVVPGDTLLPKAVVQSRQAENSGVRFVVDLWCENQHGDKVAVGTGTGLVE